MNKFKKVCFFILSFVLIFDFSLHAEEKPKGKTNTTFINVIDFKNGRFSPDIELAIDYKDGKLNLFTRSKTVGEIFKEIAKRAKIEIKVDDETAQKKVSIFVSNKTLKEGIEVVLNTIGQRDLAISYKEVISPKSHLPAEVGVTSEDKKTHDTSRATGDERRATTYEISKVEIRKRNKAEMEKITADEEKQRQVEYAQREKAYHELFKDMGKKGKLAGMMKDYAEGKRKTTDVNTYLRQATIKPEEKPLLRETLWDPKYSELSGGIAMGLIHAIADHPEESDKEFLLDLLKKKKIDFLMYAMKFTWDDRFIPGLIDIVRDTTRAEITRSTAAEILGSRDIKEAIPALEEAFLEMIKKKENTTQISHALTRITGMEYGIVDGKVKQLYPYGTVKPKLGPMIIESIEGR